jgi:Predicted permeases
VTLALFTALLFLGALVAGALGAITGLGGGVVIVPLLTLLFHVDLRYAVGASLVSVIATSSGAASAYLRDGYANIRVAMLLEVATTLGAVAGASLATVVSASAIGVVFAFVLFFSVAQSWLGTPPHGDVVADRLGRRLRLTGHYPGDDGRRHDYGAVRVPAGFGLMGMAGALSGLLGIGSGAVKVLALDRAMRLPLKVSTTTSNLMIGVTAAASAGIYLRRGYVDPVLTAPVMLGVLAGAMLGARVLPRLQVRWLRAVFNLAVLALAVQMLVASLRGQL